MSENKIYVTSSGTIITPYKRYQCRQLERLTAIQDLSTKRYMETTGFRLNGIFVTHHLPRYLLENNFAKYDIVYTDTSEYRTIPKKVNFSFNQEYELTDVQYQIVQDIMKDTQNSRWFVHLPQGMGKTFLTLYLASKFQMNTLIMCFSKNILLQWKEKLSQYTGLDLNHVLILSSKALIKAIIEKDYDISEKHIFFATPMILTLYAKEHGAESIHQLMEALGIGLKVYDEAHRNLGSMIKIDALSSVKNTIYLSGDFTQASKVKTRLFYNMFQDVRIVRPSEEQMMDLRYTNAVIVEYNTNPTELERMKMTHKRGISIWEYMDYQIEKQTIFRVIDWILDNITNLKEENRRILLLTNKIEHCDTFYYHIKDRYTSYLVGRFHGDVEPEERELAKETAQIIVATYDSFSTGIDTKNIKYVISTSLSNRVEDSQASGRARPLSDGEYCLYWILADVGFARTSEKLKDRLFYLQSLKIKQVTRLTYYDE